ncbi:MAG: ABC transporter ATP-binding protein [Verrucomicrobiota bacterium]
MPPSGAAVPRMTTWQVARRVVGYLRPYPWMALGTIGCAVLGQLASMAFPRITQYVMDDVLVARRPERLGWAIGGLAAAYLLRDVLNSVRIRLNNAFEQAVVLDLRRHVYGRLQRLPAAWFDRRSSGELMTRVIEDVGSVERLLIDGAEQGVVAILGIVGVAAFLFATNPVLAWVAMAPLPFLAAGAAWYTTTAGERYRQRSKASGALNALLMDNLQGVRQVKAFGREDHEDARFAERAGALREATLRVMRAWAWYNPGMTFVAALGMVSVLWVGGRHVLEGRMTPGELVGFLLFLGMFYQPIGQLHGLNQLAQSARSAGERIFDVLDSDPEPVAIPGATLAARWRAQGHVEYVGVVAGYDRERPVLSDVSFVARPGEVIALVGPTGAGKTTLVQLIPRFRETLGGCIRIDGRDIREIPLADLRQQVAVVSQEPFLFDGTLRENVLYGRLDASADQVDSALAASECAAFVSRLPQGLDTPVGERGVRLSVGEKQRVSIARALLKDAPILILDEATASVDTATERAIQSALDRLMRDRTSLVIAHRLGTVRGADQILVLNHGRVEERGRHDELVRRGGLYARLVRLHDDRAALEAEA